MISGTEKLFDALIDDVRACRSCARMCDSARVLNRGCGPLTAEVMIIGEAPGRLGADASQLPFHGDKAGHNFESLSEVAGIRREQLFITNAALCNPRDSNGNNATPLDAELRACATHLRRQIDIVNPRIVVTLGAAALKALAFIEPHGLQLRTAVRTSPAWFGRELIPLYHPGQRAMIHRSFANQLSDYNFLAERIRRLGQPSSRSSGSSRPDIAAVAKEILARAPRSYFALHKLCYLAEIAFCKRNGARMTSAYYIRQKDGPYCVDLHIQRLKRAGLSIDARTVDGKLWVFLNSNDLFSDTDHDAWSIPQNTKRAIDETLDRYGSEPDEKLKTSSYLTSPMREILTLERAGSNQLNAPISFL